MKPLTIDELKALQVGDWVWICDLFGDLFDNGYGDSTYVRTVFQCNEKTFECGTRGIGYSLPYSDYSKTWLAYKNKEQAEAKGEIVELPCLRQLTIQYKEKTTHPLELAYVGEHGQIQTEMFGEHDKSGAERRLAELKGEK